MFPKLEKQICTNRYSRKNPENVTKKRKNITTYGLYSARASGFRCVCVCSMNLSQKYLRMRDLDPGVVHIYIYTHIYIYIYMSVYICIHIYIYVHSIHPCCIRTYREK